MKVAILVSGGVDSSVALCLLKKQGYDLTAFYLKIWLEDELSFLGTCPWEEDLAYVQALCTQYNVPLEVVSFQKEYWDQVVSYTLNEVRSGRTPNPDIVCNKNVKFGAFLNYIGDRFDKIATGHYAQLIRQEDGTLQLCQAPDAIKDQTYFLSHLSHAQLSRAVFPIGHLTKKEVRALAEEFNVPSKYRKDSQGICFLGKLNFHDFLRYHLGDQEGSLKEFETGLEVGKHPGFWYYTIGQRQGLGLAGGPWYVVSKDPASNTVYISRAYYAQDKVRNRALIAHCNWISGRKPTGQFFAKMRHGSAFHEIFIAEVTEGVFEMQLKDNDQGVAPGQYAVLYDGICCLGGGMIIQ